MIKKILFVAGVIWLGFTVSTFAQSPTQPVTITSGDANLVAITPLSDPTTNWIPGQTYTSDWQHTQNNYWNAICNGAFSGLFPLNSSGTLDGRSYQSNGVFLFDYPGQITGPLSGSITLPSDVIPRQYRVVVQCGGATGVYNYSAGIITVSNPSYQPYTLRVVSINSIIPPATLIRGVAKSIDFTANDYRNGEVIRIELNRKSTGQTVWSTTRSESSLIYPGATVLRNFSADLSSADTSALTPDVYVIKISTPTIIGSNSFTSGDITVIDPPAQPATLSLTCPTCSPQAGETWVVGTAHEVRWESANLDQLVSMTIRREPAPGNTQAASPLAPIGLNDGVWPVTAVPNFPGEWKYVLRAAGALAIAESGVFTIAPAGTTPPPDDDLPPGGGPAAAGWHNPPAGDPPLNCDLPENLDIIGCNPPVNVADFDQVKVGGLGVRNLSVASPAMNGFLKLLGLVATPGQFLTTDSAGQVILGTPGATTGGTPDNYSCPVGHSIKTIVNGVVTECEFDDSETSDSPTGVSSVSGTGPITVSPNTGAVVVGLNLSDTIWQKRVANCPDNSAIREVRADGTVSCEEIGDPASPTGDNLGDQVMRAVGSPAVNRLKTGGGMITYNNTVADGLTFNASGGGYFSGNLTVGRALTVGTGGTPRGFQFYDGTADDAGKVLGSDLNGNASWKSLTCTAVSEDIIATNASHTKTVACPAGYFLTGGGVRVTGGTISYPESFPTTANGARVWYGRINGSATTGTVYANCCGFE